VSAEADFLREEGYSDEEIAEALGTATVPRAAVRGPWTRESVLEAVRAWASEHGRPPTSAEWRNTSPHRPSAYQASRACGCPWGEIIVAAGFPRPKGSPKAGEERAPDEPSRIHSAPISGPGARHRRDFGDIPRPDSSPELLRVIEDITGSDEGTVGRDALPAADTRHLVMSRGGKVLRLAEAMLRLQGGDWRKASSSLRRTYVGLSERVMDALELVEDDEALIRGARQLERIERAS
jgi:hypothetical protein